MSWPNSTLTRSLPTRCRDCGRHGRDGLARCGARGQLSPYAINLVLDQIGRWHDAELSDPAWHISPLRPQDLLHSFAFHLAKVTGTDAYELERQPGHHLQRYTNPPEEVAAAYIAAVANTRVWTDAARPQTLLRPHLEDGVPLTIVARETGTPLRTLEHWLASYRQDGVAGLVH